MQPQSLNLAKDYQLVLYKMAYRDRFGKDPAGLRYDYLIRKSSKRFGFSAEIYPIPVEKNESHERIMLDTFRTVVQAIKLKQYYPHAANNFMCSPMACGFWRFCQQKVLAGEKLGFMDEIRAMQIEAQRKAGMI